MERIVVVDDYGNASLINDIFSLNKLKTWAEFFFTKNIYIVGLSLDDCDFDLWWLITYRSQLLRTGHTQINNKIIYFYTYEKGHRNDEFVSCLSAMNIDVKHKEVPPNGWIAAYQDIANRIKLELS